MEGTEEKGTMAFRKALVSSDTPVDSFYLGLHTRLAELLVLLLYFSPPPQLWASKPTFLSQGETRLVSDSTALAVGLVCLLC